jgi:cysteine desulfurase
MADAVRYLDCNATSPLLPAARAALVDALDAGLGNASSAHASGRAARRLLDAAREAVAALCGVATGRVTFTSGATESLTQAVWSLAPSGPVAGAPSAPEAEDAVEAHGPRAIAARPPVTVLGTAFEHPALPAACRGLPGWAWEGVPFEPADALSGGGLGLARRLATAARGDGTGAVALLAAHNLTGLLLPVGALTEALADRSPRPRLIVDASQLFGRMPSPALPPGVLAGIDYLILAGHKLGAPRGVGALIHAADAPVRPLLPGGGQEKGLRGGTEAIPLIAALGAAARWHLDHGAAEHGRLQAMQAAFEATVTARGPFEVVGRGSPRLPQTTALVLPEALGDAETVVRSLSRAGFATSAGSACTSGSSLPAPALLALGLSPGAALRTLRVSWGPLTPPEDLDALADALARLG